jgi:hypothetical protein
MAGEINPETNQEYYAGSVEDVIRFCKALNIDSGRLAAVKPISVVSYMKTAEDIINGMFVENYFLPIKPYNQVDVNGVPHLVFPGRIRYLAQQMTAGLLMLTEFQHQEQNMNEAGAKMFEEAKKEIYQLTLYNHHIPGVRWKSRTSRTMPPNFEPPAPPVEQLWSLN